DGIRLCPERSRGLLPVPQLSPRWARGGAREGSEPAVASHGDPSPADPPTDGPRRPGGRDSGGFPPDAPAPAPAAAWPGPDRPRPTIGRAAPGCSGLEWERGRAWAFAQPIGLVWYDAGSNPSVAELGGCTLTRLLEPWPARMVITRDVVRFLSGDPESSAAVIGVLSGPPVSIVALSGCWGLRTPITQRSNQFTAVPGAP